MQGKGFELLVKQGQAIRRGEPIAKVNLETVRDAGKDNTVIVVFTSGEPAGDIREGQVVSVAAETVCIMKK